jgi:calnexin
MMMKMEKRVCLMLFGMFVFLLGLTASHSETESTTFVETFESMKDLASSGWIPSQAIRDREFKYDGRWAIETASSLVGHADNRGLVLKSAAKHHAISMKLPRPISMADEEDGAKKDALVVQYEVKLQNGLECGGAYIKLLTYETNYDPKSFSNQTPYTIMFGPDRCGMTNKVHFIFRHQNPIDKTIEEKHLKDAPPARIGKTSVLYTLIVRKDNSFEILINQRSVKKGNLLTDFEPSVNPPKMIDDPSDRKPNDWVDEAKIPDPNARRPVDWDEDEPAMILDEDARKPSDWLEDETDMIPDPQARMPSDWDEEIDGTWIPPTIPNPKCVGHSGCGPWIPPLRDNPKFRGKWMPPLIKNPLYKGDWKARKIENPAYFEDDKPYRFSKIGAVGFELWTMQSDIMFDNIFIGHNVEEADKFAKKYWLPKHEAELALEDAQFEKEQSKFESEKDTPSDRSPMARVQSMIGAFRKDIEGFVIRLRRDPFETGKREPLMLIAFGGILFFPLVFLMLIRSLFAGKSKSMPVARATRITETTARRVNATLADEVKKDEDEQPMSSTPAAGEAEEKVVKRAHRKKYTE